MNTGVSGIWVVFALALGPLQTQALSATMRVLKHLQTAVARQSWLWPENAMAWRRYRLMILDGQPQPSIMGMQSKGRGHTAKSTPPRLARIFAGKRHHVEKAHHCSVWGQGTSLCSGAGVLPRPIAPMLLKTSFGYWGASVYIYPGGSPVGGPLWRPSRNALNGGTAILRAPARSHRKNVYRRPLIWSELLPVVPTPSPANDRYPTPTKAVQSVRYHRKVLGTAAGGIPA